MVGNFIQKHETNYIPFSLSGPRLARRIEVFLLHGLILVKSPQIDVFLGKCDKRPVVVTCKLQQHSKHTKQSLVTCD